MTLVLNATPGAADANTYQLRATFLAWLASYPWAPALDDATWDPLLVQATRVLDRVDYLGQPTYPGLQALKWPRIYVPLSDGPYLSGNGQTLLYYDGLTIPAPVLAAHSELTVWLAQQGADLNAPTGLEMFQSVQLGPLSLEMANATSQVLATTQAIKQQMPPNVRALLRSLINQGSQGGFTTITRAP